MMNMEENDVKLMLLEKHLKSWNNILLLPKQEKPLNLKTSIKSIDLRSFLKEPCITNEICCVQSRKRLTADFQEFSKCLQRGKQVQKDNPKGSVPNKPPSRFERKVNYRESSVRDKHQTGGFVTASEELNIVYFWWLHYKRCSKEDIGN